jgi:glycosyltransferase involved in cell wall biosynthesis
LSALNLAAPIAVRRHIPVLVHFHGFDTGARARSLARLWLRCGLRMRVHPVSERSRDVLEEAGLDQVVGPILPNPILMTAKVHPSTNNDEVRIGFVGSPSRRKGLHLLVDCILRLRNEPVRWIIFGIHPRSESQYVQTCKKRLTDEGVDERVTWRGVVEDMNAAYRQMDILLVPSLQESWCRVAMEGMAAGLPVVGTAISGMTELFARVADSFTFPVDRPEIGAQQLRQLARDPVLRQMHGSAGREAMHAFDVQPVASQLLDFYGQLLSSPHASPKLHL